METISRDSQQVDWEMQLAAYAERLSAWPIETVERVLRDWTNHGKFWPSWAELAEQLPDPQPMAPRIGSVSSSETFAQRITRLQLHQRLGQIGVGKWKPLMDVHRTLSDSQMIAFVTRLERGGSPFQDDGPQELFKTRREWDEFAESMRSLRDPEQPHLAREPLLRIGASIEARQRPHAQRMGWA